MTMTNYNHKKGAISYDSTDEGVMTMTSYNRETGTVSYVFTDEGLVPQDLPTNKVEGDNYFTLKSLQGEIQKEVDTRRVELLELLKSGKSFKLYRSETKYANCFDTVNLQLDGDTLNIEYRTEIMKDGNRKETHKLTRYDVSAESELRRDSFILGVILNKLSYLKMLYFGPIASVMTDQEILRYHYYKGSTMAVTTVTETLV